MGDTHSWFGLLRWLAVPELGDGKPTQPLVALIDEAEWPVEEADLPLARFGLRDGDRLAGECAANVDEVATPFDLAIGADLAHRRFDRIVRLRKSLGHRPRRGSIDAGRRQLAEGLVRPFLVVVASEGREATSLGGTIGRRRPHGLQKGQMEALMPTVLLGTPGVD